MRSTVQINGDTVVKTYHSPRLFYKELASYVLLDRIALAGKLTPKLLDHSEPDLTITTTKVSGQELSDFWFNISKDESENYHAHIAALLYEISKRVQALDKSSLGKHAQYLDWELFLEDVLGVATRRADRLHNAEQRRTILAAVDLVQANRGHIAQRCTMTWLHRDLVQTNILTSGKKSGDTKLIDFEHSLIGPIEFEFANEAFLGDRWAPCDNKYLYTGHIKRQLCIKYGLRYNFHLDTLMAIIYGLEHFGYGSKVGTYGTQRCARIIREKLALLDATLRHASEGLVATTAVERAAVSAPRPSAV